MLKQLDGWHKTRTGLSVFAVIKLLIADGFFSLAVDRGNLWWYLLTLIFLIGALQNFIKLIGALFHVSRPKR